MEEDMKKLTSWKIWERIESSGGNFYGVVLVWLPQSLTKDLLIQDIFGLSSVASLHSFEYLCWVLIKLTQLSIITSLVKWVCAGATHDFISFKLECFVIAGNSYSESCIKQHHLLSSLPLLHVVIWQSLKNFTM